MEVAPVTQFLHPTEELLPGKWGALGVCAGPCSCLIETSCSVRAQVAWTALGASTAGELQMQSLELNQGEIPGSWDHFWGMVALRTRTKLAGCSRSDENGSCAQHMQGVPKWVDK